MQMAVELYPLRNNDNRSPYRLPMDVFSPWYFLSLIELQVRHLQTPRTECTQVTAGYHVGWCSHKTLPPLQRILVDNATNVCVISCFLALTASYPLTLNNQTWSPPLVLFSPTVSRTSLICSLDFPGILGSLLLTSCYVLLSDLWCVVTFQFPCSCLWHVRLLCLGPGMLLKGP